MASDGGQGADGGHDALECLCDGHRSAILVQWVPDAPRRRLIRRLTRGTGAATRRRRGRTAPRPRRLRIEAELTAAPGRENAPSGDAEDNDETSASREGGRT